MTAPATHDTHARMAADVRQLTAPIHLAAGRRIIRHPPLLDQLRNAAVPGATIAGPERRGIPDSRPPVRLDVVDLLAGVYVGISMWHAKLRLPSPPRDTDWQKAALRALVDEAPRLAPSIADWLALDVHAWWTDCARGSGWRTQDLLRIR